MNKMKHFVRWLDIQTINITGLVLLFLSVWIFIDVFSRFIFNAPLPAGAEISELTMPYIAFLSLGYTLSKGTHIRISLLPEKLTGSSKTIIEIICAAFGLVCSAAITYYASLFFWNSITINELMLANIRLPLWIGKFAMTMGFLDLTLRYLINLIDICSGHPVKQ